MEKLFFFDLETTGTKFWRNGIHQISGAIAIDGEIKERFDFKVKPVINAEIDPEALLVGNVTEEQIMQHPDMKEIYFKLTQILAKYVDKFSKTDKLHLVGYNNASFDNQFFRAFFTQCSTTEKEKQYGNYFGSWFWSDSIDVMVLASNKLKTERSKMIDFKQKTVAQWLGIEVDETKLHNAQYDIDICIQIYNLVK